MRQISCFRLAISFLASGWLFSGLNAGEKTKADPENSRALFLLGARHDEGKGVPQNSTEALKWYRQSAEQGYAPAQYVLGVKYDEGDGVDKNKAEARKWFRRAAEQGNGEAQFALAAIYSVGDGVAKNLVEAHFWYNLAGVTGDDESRKALKVIEKLMTKEQIVEATKLARDRFHKIQDSIDDSK